jgi:hypothetical protein
MSVGALVFRKESVAAAVMAFVLLKVVDLGTAYLQGRITESFAEERAERERIRTAIDELRRQSDAMILLMGAFTQSINQDDRADPEARQRLLTNIVTQRNALEQASQYLTPPLTPKVRAYEAALAGLNTACGQAQGVRTMRPCWEKASDWVVARQDLFDGIRAQRS